MSGHSTQPQQVNMIQRGKPKKQTQAQAKHKVSSGQPQTRKSCNYCGRAHQPRKCPAYGKNCSRCGTKNHFAEVCRKSQDASYKSKPVNTVDDSEYPDSSDVLLIGSLFVGGLTSDDKWQAQIKVQDKSVQFKLDTGAHANVLPLPLFQKLQPDKSLQETSTVLTAFGNTKIKPAGKIKLRCQAKNQEQVLEFYVTAAANTHILGYKACESLNLVKCIDTVAKQPSANTLFTEYKDVFTGIGEYAREYHIEVDKDVPPEVQPTRCIPFARVEKLKHTLKILEDEGIIASTDRPTDWVNNLVIVEKRNGSLRLCLDPKALNKAIKRERYTIPTPAEFQSRFAGATVFTVLDMKNAFWHVRLSESSSYLCTFNTPWGRKRFLRMPFGISSASEVLQKRNEETFSDIPGVHVIADDVIIATDEATHDATVRKVLDRAREKNVVQFLVQFTKDKVQLRVNKVTYMGNVITEKGLQPDVGKIKAIIDMPKPDSRQALQRLLGMVKYLTRM